MFELFSIYKRYPYKIPLRVRLFNLIRYFFKISSLEKILASQLQKGNTFCRRLIPPVYFYKQNSVRTVQRNGITYKLDISCLIDHAIFFSTVNEPAWNNLFNVLQTNFVVLDIGANIGFLTLNFAKKCSDGHVFAFEPDSRSFSFLASNVQLNNCQNVTLRRVALGERCEKMHLHKPYANNPGANRILTNYSSGYEQEEVSVMTLTSVVDELSISRIDLMKVDVEGFELFALKGAERVIKKWKPILFVELADANLHQQGLSSKILIEYIEELNYEVLDARTMKKVNKLKNDHHTDILCFYRSTQREDTTNQFQR